VKIAKLTSQNSSSHCKCHNCNFILQLIDVWDPVEFVAVMTHNNAISG